MLDLHSVKTCAALLLDLMDGNARSSRAVRSTLMELPRSCCTAAWLERLPCLGFSNFEKGNNALIMLRCPWRLSFTWGVWLFITAEDIFSCCCPWSFVFLLPGQFSSELKNCLHLWVFSWEVCSTLQEIFFQCGNNRPLVLRWQALLWASFCGVKGLAYCKTKCVFASWSGKMLSASNCHWLLKVEAVPRAVIYWY